MRILAVLLEQMLGPWLKGLLLPALFLGLVTAAHQAVKARGEVAAARDARLIASGRQQCISETRLAQAEASLAAERAVARRAQDDATAAARVTEEVQTNALRIEQQLRADLALARGGDDRCLSDGVLELVRRQAAGSKGGRAGGGSGGGKPAASPHP